LTQNKAKLCKNLIITLVFEKNANFFSEKWQKSQKIVIITSTPGNLCSTKKQQKSFKKVLNNDEPRFEILLNIHEFFSELKRHF
jgi:hypothetical protein